MRADELFNRLGGDFYTDSSGRKWPRFTPKVYRTPQGGVRYLKEPGIITTAKTITVEVEALRPFLKDFDEDCAFEEYADDLHWLNEVEAIIKLAGQACYASYGPNRTHNAAEECLKYIRNLKVQRHGSVIEHPNVTLFVYGVSRSLTHELVRHRVVDGPSQLSQRYVDGKVLRFVERPEYQNHPALRGRFERWAEMAAEEYAARRELMFDVLKDRPGFGEMSATDKRKAQNQAARDCLPNETETHIYFTANLRSWRHIFEMRASEHAEVAIRNMAIRAFLCLHFLAPAVFGDYEILRQPDGTYTVETEYRKV